MKKYPILVIINFLFVTCLFAYSFGFDAVKKLLELRSCPKCDLRGADLRGSYLRLVDLNGADLSGADLSGANLIGANIKKDGIKNAILCYTKTPWCEDSSL
jgi:hypothetical protein